MATSLSERIDVQATNDSRNENSPYHGELDFKHLFRADTDLDGHTDIWCEIVFADSAATCIVDPETGEALNGLFVDGARAFDVD